MHEDNKCSGGFSLLEALFAMFILAALSVVLVKTQSDANQKSLAYLAGGQLKQVSSALEEYIQDNYAALVASSGPSTPTTVTMAQLKAGNYLSDSFKNQNVWKQSYVAYVLEPSAGVLEGILVTTGGQIPESADLRMSQALSTAGPSGGYVPLSSALGHSSSVFIGAGGGWSFDTSGTGIPSPGGGHLAALTSFGDGVDGNDYLYRINVPGQPELNEMSTDLGMGDNDVGGGIGQGVRTVNFESHAVGDFACGSDDDTEGQLFFHNETGWYGCRDGNIVKFVEETGGPIIMDISIVAASDISTAEVAQPTCPSDKPNAQIFVQPTAVTTNNTGQYLKGFQFGATAGAGVWDLWGQVLTDTGSVDLEDTANRVMVMTVCAP